MEKSFLLILFYSASGSVKNLAHAIADGAEEQDIKVKLRTVPKISSKSEIINPNVPDTGEVYCSKEDLINCSGIAIGSPTRFGSMAGPLKHFLDSKEGKKFNLEDEKKINPSNGFDGFYMARLASKQTC